MPTNTKKIAFQNIQNSFLKYFEIAKINYFKSVTFFIAILSRSGTVLLRTWIFAQLYLVTFRATNNTEINGFTVASTVWSIMFVQTFYSANKPDPAGIIEDEVKTGNLAYSINKPYSFLLFQLSAVFGRIFPRLVFGLIPGVLVAILLVGKIDIGIRNILTALVLLFLGYIVYFLGSFLIGLSAFWFEDVSGIRWIYSKCNMVLGGSIFPIALFPDNFRAIAELLPFSQFFYSASHMLVSFNMQLFEKYLLISLFWVFFLGLCSISMFKRGIKKVSINGG